MTSKLLAQLTVSSIERKYPCLLRDKRDGEVVLASSPFTGTTLIPGNGTAALDVHPIGHAYGDAGSWIASWEELPLPATIEFR